MLRLLSHLPDDFDAYFRDLWSVGLGKAKIPAEHVDRLETQVRALLGDQGRVVQKLPDMFAQTEPSDIDEGLFEEVFVAFKRESAACFAASRNLIVGVSMPVQGSGSMDVSFQMLYSALEVQEHLKTLRMCAEELINRFPVDDVEQVRGDQSAQAD